MHSLHIHFSFHLYTLSVSPNTSALYVCPVPPDSLLVSALPVVPLFSRKTTHISSKTRQLTPITDTPNSKPRLVYPNRVTWSVPLVSISIAPSVPLARVSSVNTTVQHYLGRDPYPHPRTIYPSPPRSLYLLAFLILTLLLSSPLNLTRPLILTPTPTLILTFLSPLMITLSLSLLLPMLTLRLSHPVKRCLSPHPPVGSKGVHNF